MPIYEYKCTDCNEDFERLVYGNQEVSCPKCKSSKVRKKFSVFCSSGTERPLAGTGASAGCASCSKTSCSSCH